MTLGGSVITSKAQPQLDYFSEFSGHHNPTFDARYKFSQFECIYPEIHSNNLYRFSYHTQFGNTTSSLTKILMVARVSITNRQGRKLPQDTILAPCNLTLPSLFNSCKAYINNVEIMTINNFPVYSYVRTQLEATKMEKESFLEKSIYAEDKIGHEDSFVKEENPSFYKRREPFGTVDGTTGKFLWNEDEVVLTGVLNTVLPDVSMLVHPSEVKFDFELSRSDYVLMAQNDKLDCKLNLKDLVLYVLNFSISDPVYLKMQEKLNTSSLRYYFDDCHVVNYAIGQGEVSKIIETLGSARIPKSIILVFQETSRATGLLTKNCHKYPRVIRKEDGSGEAATITSCRLTCGNVSIDGLEQNRIDDGYAVNYMKYFLLNHMISGDSLPCDVSWDKYMQQFYFFYFDLSVAMSQQPEFVKSPTKTGSLRCYIDFSKPLPTPVTCYALISTDACLVLGKNGRVTKENT